MKKQICLALCLLLGLTACSAAKEPAAANIEETAIQAEQTQSPGVTFTFLTEGVELTPGSIVPSTILPKAQSVYEVPSCAIEGTDRIYDFGAFELTTMDDGTQEQIYSILLLDPNITTPEGLALGDSLDALVECYGDNYTQNGDVYTYSGNGQCLCIIAQDTTVASIEYRMILE